MNWEEELGRTINSVGELKGHLGISPGEEKLLERVSAIHPMRITRYYLSLIDKDNPSDPLRKLVVPSQDELFLGGTYDTSGEKENTKRRGLQHKYAQTALVLSTNRCAAYCRFCFRKRLVGRSSDEVLSAFREAADYIREHEEIDNVLITGGDPFVLSNKIIRGFLGELAEIKHLSFVRFGTRVPVVLPQRISQDSEFLELLVRHSRKTRRIYVVTHFNHPREITRQSIDAVDALLGSKVIVNNQTVLLKGVNDNPKTLAELMTGLVSIGVNPYYLFQCRPVRRVKTQFQVPFARGCAVVESARKRLNGHSKRFKFAMSHRSGKIEILGVKGKFIYFKQHQAKNPRKMGRIFKRKLDPKSTWLDSQLRPY